MNHFTVAVTALLLAIAGSAAADELTLMIEQDLAKLGYEPGEVDGEETMDTIIAISKFQAENNLEVSGEVSPELARALVAAPMSGQVLPPVGASADTPTPVTNELALQAAREACLNEKVAAAKATEKKKRGLGRLIGAVTRTVKRTGNYQMLEKVNDLYSATATASDIAIIAEELGISEEDVAACQSPGT